MKPIRDPGLKRLMIAAFVFVGVSANAFAKGSSVSYAPVSQQVEGKMPFSYTHALSITSPADLPTGSSVVIGFRVSTTNVPVGSVSQALSYVTFSPATLTFTDPNQTLTVDVKVNFPALTLPSDEDDDESDSSKFVYQVYTTGWPTAPVDAGATISVKPHTAPPPPAAPPSVTIAGPVDEADLSFRPDQLPAQIPFTFQATADLAAPVTAVDATCGSSSVVVSNVAGLGTPQATAQGYITVTNKGHYSFTARASNSAGTAKNANEFQVDVIAPPPAVNIAAPLPNSTVTYRVGDAPLLVPVTFSATSAFGGIGLLTAKVDDADVTFVPTGLGELVASGTVNLSYTVGGDHKVKITAVDDYGTTTAETKFTVVVIAPNPDLSISAPVAGATLLTAPGATTTNVPFSFAASCVNGFAIDATRATLDGAPVVITAATGLGTATAAGSGTLVDVGGGSHTLTVTAASSGVEVAKAVRFTVKVVSAMQPPPSVTIGAPVANASYTRVATDPALSIPLTFTATSNAAGGVITELTATLDGAPVTVSAVLGTASVNGSATLAVTSAGTHTIAVSARDAYGTASTTQTFSVNVTPGKTVAGRIFFDADRDGVYNALDFGVAGVTVLLWSGNHLFTTTSAADGSYAFANVAEGSAYVAAVPFAGLFPTKTLYRAVTVPTAAANVADFGLMLDFHALQHLPADGYTTSFWQTNLAKAVAGTSYAAQVPGTTITDYTSAIGGLALEPFDKISTKAALAVLTSTSPAAASQLSAQLLTAEYNYVRGGYINGNRTLTFLFVWWGEYVLSHPQTYTTTDMLWVEDWFAAYNRSRGAVVNGPADTAHRFSSW